MDVDAGRGFTPLTDKERTGLRNKGACFRCRQTGHMSQVCPQQRRQNNLNQTTIRTTEVLAEPTKLLTNMIKEADPKDLITALQGADEEKRTAVADGMQDF
jgi:Zinc knuckle